MFLLLGDKGLFPFYSVAVFCFCFFCLFCLHILPFILKNSQKLKVNSPNMFFRFWIFLSRCQGFTLLKLWCWLWEYGNGTSGAQCGFRGLTICEETDTENWFSCHSPQAITSLWLSVMKLHRRFFIPSASWPSATLTTIHANVHSFQSLPPFLSFFFSVHCVHIGKWTTFHKSHLQVSHSN